MLGGSWYLNQLLNCFACLYLNTKNTSLLSFKEVFLFLSERCYWIYRIFFSDLSSSMLSRIVMAAIASTMGTARGKTQGSWRPRTSIEVWFPSLSTVCCSCNKVATGLKATRKYMSSPLLMPPCIPPLWFVWVWILWSVEMNGSFCWLPLHDAPANPSPYSKP